MLSQSVIDVDVGPKATMKQGFLVVIVRKQNEKLCGIEDSEPRFDRKTEIFDNQTHGKSVNDSTIQMNIEITEIKYDVAVASWIIVSILIGITILVVIWERFISNFLPWLSISGTVRYGKNNEYANASPVHQFLDDFGDSQETDGNAQSEDVGIKKLGNPEKIDKSSAKERTLKMVDKRVRAKVFSPEARHEKSLKLQTCHHK